MRNALRLTRATRTSFVALFEQLESRQMLSFDPSGNEQYMLELLNRMRTNPAAELGLMTNSLTGEARSADPDINSALNYFNVSGPTLQSQWDSLVAAQPLAWNEDLYEAATGHSQAMITYDVQSHQISSGAFVEPTLGTRVNNAGYTGYSLVGENIYAYSESVFYGHAGLAIDWGGTAETGGIQSPPGHRNNMMNNTFKEIGISVIAESNSQTSVGPLVITQDLGTRFSLSGSSYFLGVIYDDTNSNNFYSPGEGLGGITITATPVGGGTAIVATSMSAGGYQMLLSNNTHYSVTFSGTGLSSDVTLSDVAVGTANVKHDIRAGDTVVKPDLTATVGEVSGAASPGQTGVSVNVTVQNAGLDDASGTITIKLYASTDGTLVTSGAGADTLLSTLSGQAISINTGGDPVVVPMTFNVPASFIGNYTLFAMVDTTNAVDESNEGNNTSAASVDALMVQKPDLALTLNADNLTDPVAPGTQTSATFIVNNPGASTVNASIAVKLYVSKDSTLTTTGANADKLLATSTGRAIALNPTGQTQFAVDFTVPAGLYGAYTLIGVIDTANAVSESDETNNTAFAIGALSVLGAFGTINGKANNSLTITDADGTAVTFALSGAGTGVLTPSGNAFDLAITGTDAKSNVTITTKKSTTPGDDAAVKINNVTAASRLGKFTAATADLTGSATFNSTLASLQLRNLADLHTITIGAPVSASDAVTFAFASVTDLSINSLTPIKSITASQWINDDGNPDVITAPWIGSLTTTGNKADSNNTGAFQAVLNLSGAGAPKSLTLGKATIAGTISGAIWFINAGATGAISAGAISSNFGLTVPGAVASLTTTKGDLSGNFNLGTLGAVKVKTNVQGVAINLSPATATTKSLTSLTAVGMFDSNIRSTGSLGTITLNQIDTSTIFAGNIAANNLELPTNISQVSAPTASIAGLTIKGITGQTSAASFARSVIAAGILTKVSLKVVDTSASSDFGFAADSIKSLTRTGAAAISNKSAPETLDPVGQYRVVVL